MGPFSQLRRPIGWISKVILGHLGDHSHSPFFVPLCRGRRGSGEITEFTMFEFLSDLLDACCGECGHNMY